MKIVVCTPCCYVDVCCVSLGWAVEVMCVDAVV